MRHDYFLFFFLSFSVSLSYAADQTLYRENMTLRKTAANQKLKIKELQIYIQLQEELILSFNRQIIELNTKVVSLERPQIPNQHIETAGYCQDYLKPVCDRD